MRTTHFQGNPLTLVGRVLKTGSRAPEFLATTQDMKDARLADFKGKIKVINSFPSLDTPVCDLQVKEFNKRALAFSKDAVIIGISKDLPFAQKRFCSAFDIKNEVVLSDYKTASFGINYGLQIKELNLLARAVLVIDVNDVVRYSQIGNEITQALDYGDAIKNLEMVLAMPSMAVPALELPQHCVPCEGGTPSLPKEKIERLLAQYRGWELVEDKKIVKEFKFKDFTEAKYFLDLVSIIAEEQGHHPLCTLSYGKLRVTLTTHAAGGLTDNDFIMAKIIDEVSV